MSHLNRTQATDDKYQANKPQEEILCNPLPSDPLHLLEVHEYRSMDFGAYARVFGSDHPGYQPRLELYQESQKALKRRLEAQEAQETNLQAALETLMIAHENWLHVSYDDDDTPEAQAAYSAYIAAEKTFLDRVKAHTARAVAEALLHTKRAAPPARKAHTKPVTNRAIPSRLLCV